MNRSVPGLVLQLPVSEHRQHCPSQQASLLHIEFDKKELEVFFESLTSLEVVETFDACAEEASECDGTDGEADGLNGRDHREGSTRKNSSEV